MAWMVWATPEVEAADWPGAPEPLSLRSPTSQTAGLTVHSRTGQFVVRGDSSSTPTLSVLDAPADATQVALAPDPLAVSCERVKSAVLWEVGAPDQWRGKVHVTIRSRLSRNKDPHLVSTRFADGWEYSLGVPGQMNPVVLVRALVHVVLMEIANRRPARQAAEVPLWLVEGVTGSVLGRVGPDLVVRPTTALRRIGDQAGQLNSRAVDQVGFEARSRLLARLERASFLSFEELSLPGPLATSVEGNLLYRDWAEVFVRELQALPEGRPCLAGMLGELAGALNWQTAFLKVFAGHFGRMLDVEKWWSVAAADYLRGDQPHTWSMALSLEKLGETLSVPAQTQEAPGVAPRHCSVSLQRLLSESSLAVHAPFLDTRVRWLQSLKWKCSPSLVPLVEQYERALGNYLAQSTRSSSESAVKHRLTVDPAMWRREVLRQLDMLDGQRARWGAQQAASTRAGDPGAQPPRDR